ncbi:MAG: FtsX-like permease family protein, partial [Candidatus Asgardarchaeia archaeon]
IVFSPQIFADSYIYHERYSFVPIAKNDILVKVQNLEKMEIKKGIVDERIKRILSSKDYIIGFYDIYQVDVQFLYKKDNPYNIFSHTNLTIVNITSFHHLNYSIVEGNFTKFGVIISERIANELEININDSIELMYIVWLRNRERAYYVDFNVTGIFQKTPESFFTTDIVISPEYFKPKSLTFWIVQDFSYFPLNHIYVVDVDENFIDFINPEITLFELNGLSSNLTRTGYLTEELYPEAIQVTVESRLFVQLNGYINTRQAVKVKLFLNIVPLLFVFSIIYLFIIEYMMSAHRKELAMMRARGLDIRFSVNLILNDLIHSFALGYLLGLVFSIIINRVYAILLSWLFYGYEAYKILLTLPIVLSISTILLGTLSGIPLFILSIFLYAIKEAFPKEKEGDQRFAKNIIKRLYSSSFPLLFNVLALIFSASMMYYVYTHSAFIQHTALPTTSYSSGYSSYILAFSTTFITMNSAAIIASFMLIVSITYILVYIATKFVLPRLSTITRLKNAFRAYIAIKNLTRKQSKILMTVFIVAVIISTNVLTLSTATMYEPYTFTFYKEALGSDITFAFRSQYNLTTVYKFIDSISKVKGIENYSVIFGRTINLENYFVRIYGINPYTFAECFFVSGSKLLKETNEYLQILTITNTERSSIISRSLAEKLNLVENISYPYYDSERQRTEYFMIEAIVDFDIPYIWNSYYVLKYSDVFSKKYILSSRQSDFIFVNQSYFEGLTSYDVIVLFKLSSGSNATVAVNSIKNNIDRIPIAVTPYPTLLEYYYISSTYEEFQEEIGLLTYKIQVSSLDINYVYALILLILVMWVYSISLTKERFRELGILLAIGMKKRDIALSIFYENIYIYIISILLSFVGIVVLAPVFAIFFGLSIDFVYVLYSHQIFYRSLIGSLLTALIAVVIFSAYVTVKSTFLDTVSLLKFEWTQEEFETEIGVFI